MAPESCTAHGTCFCSSHEKEVRVGIASLHIACKIIVRGTKFVDLLHDLNRLEKIL